MNENGEVIGEDLVGNVADLPVEDEYIDDQGRVISRVQDDSGNAYELVLDDEGNVVEVRDA
jgi:YD repeat-containing protein